MSGQKESTCCSGTILQIETSTCGCAEGDKKVVILVGCDAKDNDTKAEKQTTSCCGDS